MTNMDIANLTIKSAREALDSGEYSAVELTEAYLAEISKKNDDLNAYLEVFTESAIEDAKRADEIIKKGEQTMLTGIPIAVKDNILIKGKIASAASKILSTHVAAYDSTVIAKLKAQGIAILGRVNMDEFAMGGSTENSAYGVTKNPNDLTRVAGGSSGGSAAAVAGGLALAALGSDTGGSIRQPASFCGIVGLKPTYGNVSRFGIIALGSSLDQVGPLAKNIEDAKILFEAIRGEDKNDSTSLPEKFFNETPKPKVIGVPKHFLESGVDEDVLDNFNDSLRKLEEDGYEIKEIELPNFKYALAAYYIIMPAEASSNLARFDGMRFGKQESADTFNEVFTKSRRLGFGAEARRRILIGTYVLSSGYYDAYYNKAVGVRDLIRADLQKAFEDVDIIATPTSPEPAFKIGEKANDPLAMYAADIFTVPINIAGVPALSVPAGVIKRGEEELPTGLQFIAPHGAESALFTVGASMQSKA